MVLIRLDLKNLIYILLAVLFLCSCITYTQKGNVYRNKKHYTFEVAYSQKDTLHIHDYILHGFARNNKHAKIQLNDDSLFNIFKRSITKLNIPLSFANSHQNAINPNFEENKYLVYKKIDFTYLYSLAKNNQNKTILIPIIYKNYSWHNGYGPNDTYPTNRCFLILAIFIIKNDTIVYFKILSLEESIDTEYNRDNKYEDFNIPISQERWDNLVEDVMLEYINRLK